MENRKRKTDIFRRGKSVGAMLFWILSLTFFAVIVDAQSTDQNYPTPITVNEIGGKIAARDVGDARLTTYFYVFSGTQGDIFINVKTANLDGDIDVFALENLRPLTKITVFSDRSETETGRVVYLRKPEKLILRVQGRSPNDNSATFNLKFAGSFAAAAGIVGNDAPELPTLKNENQSEVIVNSVGTIIGVKPKPTPAPIEVIAESEPPRNKPKRTKKTVESESSENSSREAAAENNGDQNADSAVKSGNTSVAANENKKSANSGKPSKKPRTKRTTAEKSDERAASDAKKAVEPNPLENVQLVILFKDGTKIERAMSEVLRVGVDKGVLTLITKDGKIARYPILDVSKMTIE